MCRLLGFVSNSAVTIQDLGGSDFADFIKLSEFHKDSWGLALIDGENSLLEKRVESAASSPSFTQVLTDRFAKGGLLHFRWASPGIEVTDENAHPFTYEDIAFIHNGSFKPYDTLISEIPESFLALRKGTGDSELFFLMSLAHIDQEGFVAGVLKTVRRIKMNHSFSSINSMFLNSDYLVVVAEHHPEKKPDWAEDSYYELKFRVDSAGILVSSSGWNQAGWLDIPNHSALIVDRKTLKTELVPL